MNIDYQNLIKGIFVCALPAVDHVIKKENISAVIDLRAEAQYDTKNENVNYVNIPLIDGEPNQKQLLQKGIKEVIKFYKEGKQVVLHWQGGKSRTGSVALRVLLELNIVDSIDKGLQLLKEVRPEIVIHPEFIKDLEDMYTNLR